MESSQPHCELELSVEFPGLEGFAVPLEDVGADDHDDYYSNYEQRQSPLPCWVMLFALPLPLPIFCTMTTAAAAAATTT